MFVIQTVVQAGTAFDINPEKSRLVFGDAAGTVHFEQICYST